jgi:formate hydrogenlyase subunit 3/multisubunit Na+/H+ antiporter MnhD subunit
MQPVTPSLLPLLLVAWPLLAALVVHPLGRRSDRGRDYFVVAATGIALCAAAALAAQVLAHGWLHAGIPALAGRLEFSADHFGALFALFGAFVWFCATVYSPAYLANEPDRNRYHAASLVVLSAYLGVVLAGNLVTLFVFFETLGLVAFLLVVHTGTAAAKRAAIQYLWMTILGGVALLAGIMLVYSLGGGGLAPIPVRPGMEGTRTLAAVLLVIGFGVKAGMVPLHIWLPNAHPVAPSPASALLSGVMIKAGAYGLFRCLSALFRPEVGTGFADEAWGFSSQLGLWVLWLGIVTMATGVVLALGQRDAKRMLAYHSISQMGFMLAGIGAGAYLAEEGAMGTAGGLMHAVNHALFKALLFLGIGAVAFRTGRLDMYALGGLWRRMPVTFAFMLVASAGIAGVPLFNGFVSKCLIHHALVSAQEAQGGFALQAAERVYILVCAGTAASFIKLIGLVFLAPRTDASLAGVREAPAGMLVAMGALAIPIVGLGLRPDLLLQGVVAPGLAGWGMPDAGVRHYLAAYYLSSPDVFMALLMLGMGAAIFGFGMKTGLFHLSLPRWLSVEAGYHGLAAALRDATLRLGRLHGELQHRLNWALRVSRRRMLVAMRDTGQARRRLAETLLAGAPGSPEQAYIESAWLVLDQERQATIRAALASRRDERPEAAGEATRAIACLLAENLFEARLELLTRVARSNGAGAARGAFSALYRAFPMTRAEVAEAAGLLAGRRAQGEDIVPAVSLALRPMLARERAAFRGRLGAADAGPGGEAASPVLREPSRGALAWAMDLARLVVAELRQPPSSWPRSEAVDADPGMVATRRRIARYSRDVGLNVAAIFGLLALFAAALWLAAG